MNSLANFLVKNILNEDVNPTTALFGGGFKPPTAGHLEVIKKSIANNPEIDKVIIYVGGKVRDGIAQDQSIEIWDKFYKSQINKPVEILPSVAPVKDIYRYAKNNPEENVYWVIGAREGREDDLKDIASRSISIDKYPNLQLKTTSTPDGGMSGTNARKAIINNNFEEFEKYLPDNVDKNAIWGILTKQELNEKRMSIPDDVKSQIDNFLTKIESNRKEILKSKQTYLGDIKYKEAGSDIPSSAKVYAAMSGRGTIAYYNSKDTKNPTDNLIVINTGNPLVRAGISFPSLVKKVTGISVYDAIKDVLYHEMIHALDPTSNVYRKKDWGKTYNIGDPASYYSDLGEFKAFTGQFQEKIIDRVKSIMLSSSPSPYEIEEFLQHILDYFSGKTKEIPKPIVNFLYDMSKEGIFKKLARTTTTLAALVGVELFDVDDPTMQFDNIRLIKKYNPAEYKRFLKNIYLTAKEGENITNNWVKKYNKQIGLDFGTTGKIYDAKKLRPIYVGGTGKLNEGDPKIGTGKKPKGSGRRLYTDEDPSDTVKVKFSSRQDIIDTLNKSSFKSKSHARQSQVINLIHQRVRAAYNRAKDPGVKRRLKTALDYAEKRKEASKKKTQRLKKENIDPKVQAKHKGKSAPFGSAYEPVKEKKSGGRGTRYRAIEKRGNQYYFIQDNPFSPGIRQEFGPYKTKAAALKKMGTFPPASSYRDITEKDIKETGLKVAKKNMDDYKRSNNPSGKKPKDPFGLNQFARELIEEENFDNFDYPKHLKLYTKYMLDQGMDIKPLPKVKFVNDDVKNAKEFLGKTAYYDPNKSEIVLYTLNRHPKDVMRSFSHEMIHHLQNIQDRLGDVSTTNTNQDDHIDNLEKEANLLGTMTFRHWTDTLTEGILKEGRYDKISNKISSDIFNFWKKDFEAGKEASRYFENEENDDLEIDIDANITFLPNSEQLTIDGGAEESTEGSETAYLEIRFEVDPEMLPEFWEEISMNLKDVVRHEIEHITQAGTFSAGGYKKVYKKVDGKWEETDEYEWQGKDFKDDQIFRKMIDMELLPKAEYFKLAKEVDANLQGMYFRAKKEKRPFGDIINNYLDAQDITTEEKEEILNLWRSRNKALNLPKF